MLTLLSEDQFARSNNLHFVITFLNAEPSGVFSNFFHVRQRAESRMFKFAQGSSCPFDLEGLAVLFETNLPTIGDYTEIIAD